MTEEKKLHLQYGELLAFLGDEGKGLEVYYNADLGLFAFAIIGQFGLNNMAQSFEVTKKHRNENNLDVGQVAGYITATDYIGIRVGGKTAENPMVVRSIVTQKATDGNYFDMYHNFDYPVYKILANMFDKLPGVYLKPVTSYAEAAEKHKQRKAERRKQK